MERDNIDAPPTSTAATTETEPEVVAGISSAEGGPDLPLAIHVEGSGFGVGRMLLLLGAGAALGYVAMRLLRRST